MKRLLIIGLVLGLFLPATMAATFTNFWVSNPSSVNDPAPIAHGGTGQTTAATALTALGGISSNGPNAATAVGFSTLLVNPTIQPNNGSSQPTVLFSPDANQNDDQGFIFSGSPLTSGAATFFAMKATNVVGTVDAFDPYYTIDALAWSMDSVGFNATNGDLPATALGVANPPWAIAFAHAHSGANVPNLYMTGDVTNGDMFEVGYWNGATGDIRPLPMRYDNAGTNVFFRPASMPKLFEINQDNANVTIYNPASGGFTLANGTKLTTTNGLFIKANGAGNVAVMLDPTDITAASLADAQLTVSNMEANTINVFPNKIAYDINGLGDGLAYQAHGANTLMLAEHGHVPLLVSGVGQGQIGSFNSVIVGGTDSETTNTTFGGNNNSVFQVMGSVGFKTTSQAANYAMTLDDEVVRMNGSAITNTLPDASSFATGRFYTIKNINSGSCFVNTTSSQTIDGMTNWYLSQNQSITVQSDGANWKILNNDPPIIQAGGTNVTAATSVIVQFLQIMPNTNYAVVLQGEGNPLVSPQVTAKTITNFTFGLTAFTGRVDWTITGNTQ